MTVSRLVCLKLILVLTMVVASPESTWSTPRCEGKLLKTEISERQEQTLSLLRAKKYDELQHRMDGFLDAYVAGKLPDEELFYEFGAFDRWGPFLTPLIQEWVERFPKSYAAYQAMALHLSSIAWQVRGIALAKDTSDQQIQEFERQLGVARDWAARAVKLHPKPILAYQQLMVNSKALLLDRATLSTIRAKGASATKKSKVNPRPDVIPLLEESIRIQSNNVIVREAYVAVLAPRWGGNLDALQEYSKPAAHLGLSADRIASVTYAATMEIASDYWFRKQFDQAVLVYQAASKICRLNQPLVDIANIRLGQERYREALVAAEGALALVPNSFAGTLLKARSLRGLERHSETVSLLKKLAPEGSSEVAYLLGEYYASGKGGLKRDMVEARRLLSIAARAGNEQAIKRLGSIKPDN